MWKWILVGFLVLLLVVGAGSFYVYRSNKALYMSDEEILRSYQPAEAVADIVEKTKMTDHGKAVFYRSDPHFVDIETFKKACAGGGGREPLGCYGTKLGGTPRITLLQIDDPKFSDGKYFIAAHEMLHAAFFRMSEAEKDEVSRLVQPEFLKRQDDAHLVDIALSYQDDGVIRVVNELHSYLATEYADLSAELEEHYKKYFNDRQSVVDLYNKSGYGSRVKQIDQLTAEGTALYKKIEAREYGYEELIPQYNAKARQADKLWKEIEEYYTLYNPSYTPLEAK